MRESNPVKSWRFAMFSKHIKNLPVEKAAAGLKAAGLSGIDLTARPGGHAEPANIEQDLPRVSGEFKKHGIDTVMLTTEIKSASDPLTERILKTASSLGIKYYKTGYYMWEGFGTLAAQRQKVKDEFKRLAELNSKYGMTGGYHNHSANFFGAALWDIHEVLDGIPRELLGFYFDPAHAAIEGGSCGWEMGMELLAEKIMMVAVKDFRWLDGNHGYGGGRRHSMIFCPLTQGNVPWAKVIGYLKKINFTGPVSFHSEYQGQHCHADLTDEQVLAQTRNDVEFFRSLLK